jgi:hypothetical protein
MKYGHCNVYFILCIIAKEGGIVRDIHVYYEMEGAIFHDYEFINPPCKMHSRHKFK